MTTAQDLDIAIKGMKIIKFTYENHSRVIEPYLYGINGSHGVEKQLQCYQISGGSRSGNVPGWKNFSLSKITGLTITEDSFTRRADYNPLNTHYTTIITKV